MSKRVRFFSIHFLCSVLIILIASAIIFGLWYPEPLAKALGVTPLFLMLILIDIVIGPLFGWLVYKEGKKTLKFDLSVVIVLQICAFSYGFYAIAQGRPAWIVFDSLNFTVVKNSDIETKNIDQAKAEFQQSSWFKPAFVTTQFSSVSPQKTLLNSATKPQSNLYIHYPVYYTNIASAKMSIPLSALPLSLLEKYNDKNIVDKMTGKNPQADAWIALSAPVQDMVVLIDKEKGEVIKIVDLRPWH